MQENKNVNAPVEANEEEQLIEQARIRREKLAKLVSEGKNPYEQVKYPVDADSETIKNNFEAYEGKTVCMAGRMMSRRIMGKASFSHIADRSGSIQIYVTRQDIGEENYMSYKKDYDIGDIFGFKGFVFKTQTGEVSVHVTELTLLTKSLLPLPEKYNGLQDKDMKYRLRHLDLIMNKDVRDTFRKRSLILKEIRNFLDKGAANANIDTSVGEFGMFHSVNVFSSVYLPEGVEMIAMCTGAVAQPVKVSLDEPGKIPLSDAYHFGMFYYYGTKAVMPDLIFKVASA